MKKFLSCDWGTSSFRLRLVNADSKEVSGEVLSDEGIATTQLQWLATGRPESERISFYLEILNNSIDKLPRTVAKGIPIICSGMASSSIGLTELPYQKFPFTWNPSQIGMSKLEGSKEFPYPLYLLSGFRTNEDIMRGEEMLLLGCPVDDEGERIFIFPGTHSKHVFVNNKTGIDFRTYMTGEIFSLLAEKSILRNVVRKGMDEESFNIGFQSAMEGNLLHQAFQVRTRQLLQQTDPVSNFQFLSGLLIGTELRDLKGSHYPVYLVASENLSHAYRLGLGLMGIHREIVILNADEMLINGHCKMAELYL